MVKDGIKIYISFETMVLSIAPERRLHLYYAINAMRCLVKLSRMFDPKLVKERGFSEIEMPVE